MKWMLFVALFGVGTAASAEECELHVWPASGTGASNGGWLSNLGLAGAAADYERNKDANLRDQVTLIEALPPRVQAEALASSDLASLLGMSGAQITFESRPLETRSIRGEQARRTASAAACYAELIVALNFYRRSALYGRQLTSHMAFKDFRGGKPEAKIVGGKATHAIPLFPPASPTEATGWREQLIAAFTANVREFAARARPAEK